MKAKRAEMFDMTSFIKEINSSLGFHIPAAKAQYLEGVYAKGYEAFVEAILYVEGLDSEDDVRKDLQRKVGDFFLRGLRRGSSLDKPRKTLTLPRRKSAEP
jgi:hypothetical protein